MLVSALSAAQAESQAAALREVMYTLEQPAWSNLSSCACALVEGGNRYQRGGEFQYPEAAWRPNPREPPVTTTTFPSREKMFLKSLS